MKKFNLQIFKEGVEKEINETANLLELNKVFKKYLGRKGEINKIFKEIKNLNEKEKKKIGKELNYLKKSLEKILREKKGKLEKKTEEVKNDRIDVTIPGKKIEAGHLHPITLVTRKIIEIFQAMGFSVAEGPEIETEWYNFDALNIPKNHPARDAWDTFWLKNKKGVNIKKLLRTHTSPVQIRYMEKNNPPIRIIAPGRCYRHEATDASHNIQFHQLEGLMVGKNISVANFKAIIQEFLRKFFNKEIIIRLRPSYFPFTEPSFEVDMSCLICNGMGCSVCGQTGWLEVIPGGMVQPNVFKAVGYNPKEWQGFAFGMGLDRLVMMKYKIDDIRLFYSGDLRFLKQF